ncbi:DsbC family protein [Turicimonas muris]|nr:DsbC family protein [Turicimonas muris]MBS4768725.1 DsbC family protein [Burkholderiales bacterium]
MFIFNETQWPLEDAIKIVKGNGSAKIAVFEDPNCRFCQRYDRETLSKINNVTIYVFLVPFLSEDSMVKACSIWNSVDRAKAFNAWMVEGVEPTANPTERAEMVMKRNIDLMERVGIQSVPATFVADGRGPFGGMHASSLMHKMIHL